MRPPTLSLLLAGILPSVAATAAPLPDFEASYKLEQHYLPVRIWQRDSDDEEYQSDLEEFSHSLRGKKNKR